MGKEAQTLPPDGRQSETAMMIARGVRRLLRARGFSSLTELALTDGRRADIVAVSGDGEVIIVEVKSCAADFRADRKWRGYAASCDRLYFAISEHTPVDLMPPEAGLIVADPYSAEIVREAEAQRMSPASRRAVLLRFALYHPSLIQTREGFPNREGFDSMSRTMEFAMPIPLRDDFDATELRLEAKKSKDGGQARRLLALATIYDGSTRTEAAKIGGVTLQIVRDWVLKFNAQGPSGLIAGKAPGQTPRLMTEHRAALARMVEDGPIPAVHGVVRWRLVDLCQWLFEEYHVVVSTQTMSRELRAMDYRKLTARPKHHAQAATAIEDFKKASRRAWRKSRARRASASTA